MLRFLLTTLNSMTKPVHNLYYSCTHVNALDDIIMWIMHAGKDQIARMNLMQITFGKGNDLMKYFGNCEHKDISIIIENKINDILFVQHWLLLPPAADKGNNRNITLCGWGISYPRTHMSKYRLLISYSFLPSGRLSWRWRPWRLSGCSSCPTWWRHQMDTSSALLTLC